MGTFQNIKTLLICGLSAAVLAGCSAFDGDSTATASKVMGRFDVNMYPLNKLICDPMGGGNPENPGMGLKASLFYTNPDQPHYNKLADYFSLGVKSPQNLFFSQIHVPTRLFDKGFPTETGGVVKDDNGNKLIEYFAIRYTTVLKLAEGDEEGEYEFALLSDDGTRMVTRINGEEIVVVDNDGDHPTKMGCGSHKLNMTLDSEYLVNFEYYQGPRHHISFIPLWRKVSDDNKAEKECGKEGNERYFDYNNDSKPQQAYKDILSRGWKPIAAANYNLPQSAIFNPCVDGYAPKITNFSAVDIGFGRVEVTWDTDVPATTQVRYVDMGTGAETLTVSDNLFRTSHRVVVEGLAYGRTYMFQGVSISETYGKSLSAPKTLFISAPQL